jgi:hypothetical protein
MIDRKSCADIRSSATLVERSGTNAITIAAVSNSKPGRATQCASARSLASAR